ncbi:hypothetical protein, partial [Pseudovibrio flavus]|uniref:hypothetical protein n=1 Tax=Pseudovibrio flavus TaxID=2529854 RepID=UPI00211CD27E
RRQLLQLAAAFVASPFAVSLALSEESTDSLSNASFSAFLDTLIPSDDQSPAASSLEIPAKLLSFSKESDLLQRLILLGTQWLDQVAPSPFHELSEADRVTVVSWMAQSDFNEIPRRYYELMRSFAMVYYYAEAEARTELDLYRAPQPQGAMPPWT